MGAARGRSLALFGATFAFRSLHHRILSSSVSWIAAYLTIESGKFSFISPCITSVFPAHNFQTVSIASDLLSSSVKRALLSVKGSHKFETERQKQTPRAVNQAFCQLARGVRLPATFLTLCILVFVTGVSWASARLAEPVGWKRQGWCSVLGSLPMRWRSMIQVRRKFAPSYKLVTPWPTNRIAGIARAIYCGKKWKRWLNVYLLLFEQITNCIAINNINNIN